MASMSGNGPDMDEPVSDMVGDQPTMVPKCSAGSSTTAPSPSGDGQAMVKTCSVDSISAAPKRRRSPRIEQLEAMAPSIQQLQRMDAQELFERRVAPRVERSPTAKSPRRPRTRSQKKAATTAKNAAAFVKKLSDLRRRMSPHVPAQAPAAAGTDDDDDAGTDDDEDVKEDQRSNEASDEEHSEAQASGVGEEEEGEEESSAADDEEEDAKDGEEESEAEEVDGRSSMKKKEVATLKRQAAVADDEQRESNDDETVVLVQKVGYRVFVAPIVDTHDTWEAWLAYEVQYSAESFQVLSVFFTQNASGYNKKMSNRVKAKRMLPEEFGPFERIYICTHGSKPKSKGKGKRPIRWLRWTGCPFKFAVQRYWDEDLSCWRLVVKPRVMWHNHIVDPEVYETYPIARGVKDPATLERAREMLADGMSRAQIYSFFLDQGENMFKGDVDNFVNANRHRISLSDDDTLTAIELAKLANADPTSVITVDETDRKETGVISFTTTHMRLMFSRFGHLLLCDCTYKTNRLRYQLCTFMVMDENGAGQVVQQSLFETNGDWHMDRALEHLKRANPDSWRLVRVIMVDKDMNEIRVLNRHFPEAQVLICHFHVLKYLSEVSTKPEYGKISSEDKKAFDLCVRDLVYSATEDAYEHNKLEFRLLCDRVGFFSFCEYMTKNWFSCEDMWVLYLRNKLPHLRNHTNNRLENWFGKFKATVPDNASISRCIKELVAASRRCKKDYERLLRRPGQHYNALYDKEMKSVLSQSTAFVAKAVEPQYTAAMNKFDVYGYDEDTSGGFVLVKGKKYTHVVDLSTWECDCDFAVTMLLPCRHAMAFRRHKGYPEMIPVSRIDIRWKRAAHVPASVQRFLLNMAQGSSPSHPKRELSTESHQCERAPSDPKRVLSTEWSKADSAARYNEAMRRLQPICSELAEIEDEDEFHKYLDFLEVQYRNVRLRKRTGTNYEASSEDDEDDDAKTLVGGSQTVELSQTNSLWSADVGDVPPPALHTLQIQRPTALIIDACDQEHMEGNGEDMDGDDELKPRCDEDEHASGDGADSSGDGENMARHGEDMDEHGEDMEEHGEDMVKPEDIHIALNRATAKTGRPKLDKKAVIARLRQERILIREAAKARKAAGELTMLDVVDAIEREMPPPREVLNRLAGIAEWHSNADTKRPRCVELANPTLNENAYYTLPPILLKACKKAFPVGTRPGEAIRVCTPDAQSQRPSPKTSGAPMVECVRITGVGLFSREQIILMYRVKTLRKYAKMAQAVAKWLRTEVASRVAGPIQPSAITLADELDQLFPFRQLQGLPQAPDHTVSSLYKVVPPKWLGDGVIASFCQRLEQVHGHVRYSGFVSGVKKKSKGQQQARCVEATTVSRMQALAAEPGVSLLLLPVNFGEAHWCTIYVEISTKTIYCYDSKETYYNALEELSKSLLSAFPAYKLLAIKKPFQIDFVSCGLFVCFKMWRHIDSTISDEMTEHALFTRRLEFIHFVLRGNKIVQTTP